MSLLSKLLGGEGSSDENILNEAMLEAATENFSDKIEEGKKLIKPISIYVYKQLVGLLSGTMKSKDYPDASKKKMIVLQYNEAADGLAFMLLDNSQMGQLPIKSKEAVLQGSRIIKDPVEFVESMMGKFLNGNENNANTDKTDK